MSDGPKFNEYRETYEDFIARLTPDEREALAAGKAGLLSPMDGLRMLLHAGEIILRGESAEDEAGGVTAWRQELEGYSAIECQRAIDNIERAGQVAGLILADLQVRQVRATMEESGDSEILKDFVQFLREIMTDDEREPWEGQD